MIETELALNVIRTLGLLIGIVIGLYEIMNIGKTRKMEFLTRLATHWASYEFIRTQTDVLWEQHYSNVEEWGEYYSPVVNPDAASKLYSQLKTFNNIGILLKNKIVDLDFILQSTSVILTISFWEKVKPVIEHWRKIYNDPNFYKSFEYLYEEVKKKHPETRYVLGEQELEMQERLGAERGQG